jgi:hypothetical protein
MTLRRDLGSLLKDFKGTASAVPQGPLFELRLSPLGYGFHLLSGSFNKL